jgi:hypothetical protein
MQNSFLTITGGGGVMRTRNQLPISCNFGQSIAAIGKDETRSIAWNGIASGFEGPEVAASQFVPGIAAFLVERFGLRSILPYPCAVFVIDAEVVATGSVASVAGFSVENDRLSVALNHADSLRVIQANAEAASCIASIAPFAIHRGSLG